MSARSNGKFRAYPAREPPTDHVVDSLNLGVGVEMNRHMSRTLYKLFATLDDEALEYAVGDRGVYQVRALQEKIGDVLGDDRPEARRLVLRSRTPTVAG